MTGLEKAAYDFAQATIYKRDEREILRSEVKLQLEAIKFAGGEITAENQRVMERIK